MGLIDKISMVAKVTKEIHNEVSNIRGQKSTPKKNKIDDTFAITLKNCKKLKTDLVYCPKHFDTCKLCSIYQDRVYSINGKDKRFPKLPEEVFIYGGFHEGCRHNFYAFTYGVSTMSSGKKDAIKWSNRPFE